MPPTGAPPPSRPLPPGFALRPMLPTDAPSTAGLHLKHLSLGLFPRLGHRFMTQWHLTFTGSSHAWAGVVTEADDVVAVVLVTTDQRTHTAEVLTEHRWAMVRAGGAALLRHPRVLVPFLRTRALRYLRRAAARGRRGGEAAASIGSREVIGVVHAVITAESARGRGLAAALLEAAEDQARRRGTTALALVTDYPEAPAAQSQASGMYDRLGWQRIAVRRRGGRRIAEHRRFLAVVDTDTDHDRRTTR